MDQTPHEKENQEPSESQDSSPVNVPNAPKFGIIIPNRIFVGGISSQTTESDLAQLFSNYGNVLNTKIIADRAGVSKGYGFVTFESEKEAQQLQNESQIIMFQQRRLNIAPAIRKQSFHRSFDSMPPVPVSPVPVPAGQLYRQPGVPFFQNGMAFYPAAPSPQPQPMTSVQNPTEAPPVYPPGAYGGVAPNSPAPNFTTFSYPNQFYYQAPYQYHLGLEGYPVGDANHIAPNQVLIPAGGAECGSFVFPNSPYVFAQQSGAQSSTYFDPQNVPPMTPVANHDAMPPVLYTPPRGYDLVYTECPPPTQQPNLKSQGEAGNQETSEQVASTPLHHSESGAQRYSSFPRGRGKPRGGGKPFVNRGGHKPFQNRRLNNNDPQCGDRNLSFNHSPPGGYQPRSIKSSSLGPPPTHSSLDSPNSPQNSRSPAQVPALQYMPGPRQHYGVVPAAPQYFSSPRRGIGRNIKFNGRGGRTLKSHLWSHREHEENVPEDSSVLANALTPPITPQAPHDTPEDLSASLSGLNI